MLHRTALLLCLGVVSLAAFAAVAPAGEGRPMGGEHGRHLLADLDANAARLGISDETVTEIHGIVADGTAAADRLRAQLDAARAALRSLLSAPRPDESAVIAQAQQIGALDTKLLELRLQTLLRVRPLLTDAQIEALRAIRLQRLASVRDACRSEINAACADAVSGREIVHCLRAHHDQLSDACHTALSELRPGGARP